VLVERERAEGAEHPVVDEVLGVERVPRQSQPEPEQIRPKRLDRVDEAVPALLEPLSQVVAELAWSHVVLLGSSRPP
jgi:hypothetical protein